MKSTRLVLAAALLGVTLLGCGGGGGGSDTASQGQQPQLDPPRPEAPLVSVEARDPAPAIAPDDRQAVVQGNNALCFDLFRAFPNAVAVSPTPVATGLAKLYPGAAGATQLELAAAADFALPTSRLLPSLNGLDLDLSNRAGFRSSPELILQSRYGYQISYLDLLARNFGLIPTFVDFARSGSNVRFSLREPVRLQTAWAEPFDPAQTQLEWFKLLEGGSVHVPMLRRQAQFAYAQREGYLAVELLLAAEELSVLFLLPDEGQFTAFEAALDGARLVEIAADLAPAEIDLALPKFHLGSSELPLLQLLKDRGLSMAATADAADFSGIDGTKDLYLSSAEYSTGFALDEAGVDGSAQAHLELTDAHPGIPPGHGGGGGVIIISETAPQTQWGPAIPVKLGRPFLFAVRDARTGSVLFLGRVRNPAPDATVTYEMQPARAQTLVIEGTLIYRSE